MIRKHESSVSWKAGTLAVAVHVVLFAALLVSFNWKAAHTVIIATEVDLWDKLPAQNATKPEPKPEPVLKEDPKPDPKVEEKQKLEEQQKLESEQAEIALEKKKQELAEKEKLLEAKKLEEKKLEDKRKKEEEKKKLLAAMRDEDLQDKPKKDNIALKKLQQEALNEEIGDSYKKASAASANEKGAYIGKIQAEIRRHINNAVCGEGKPVVKLSVGLLPSGELIGSPKITKSSNIEACDDAVERAILGSQLPPMPNDPALRAEFRNFNLTIFPND